MKRHSSLEREFIKNLVLESKEMMKIIMMKKTRYQVAVEDTLSSIMRNCSLFDEKVMNIIVGYFQILFWNDEKLNKINPVYFWRDTFEIFSEWKEVIKPYHPSYIILGLSKRNIVLNFDDDDNCLNLFKEIRSIVLVESAKSLTVKYDVEKTSSKVVISSKTEMNGRSVVIGDYIESLCDVFYHSSDSESAQIKSIFLFIKSIDVSPSLNITINLFIKHF